MLWMLVGACTPALTELTLHGDPTESQQILVQAEVLRFLDWVEAEQLPVRRIQMVDEVPVGHAGSAWGAGTIELDRSLEGDALTRAVRHALCHALDEQAGHASDALFEDLASRAPEPEDAAAEAFAVMCQLGADIAGLLEAGRCDDDPVAYDALAYLRTEVWPEVAAPAVVSSRPDATGGFVIGPTALGWDVLPTSDDRVVELEARYPNDFSTRWFVDVGSSAQVAEPTAPYAEPPPPPLPPGASWTRMEVRGSPGGPAVVAAGFGDVPAGFPSWARRAAVFRAEGPWMAVDPGCVTAGSPLGFWVTGEDVFFAWQAGDQIVWGPAEVPPG